MTREKWQEVIREVQHATGLGDDAFTVGRDGKLIITGTGYAGDLTRREKQAAIEVLERRDLVAWERDGVLHVTRDRGGTGGAFGLGEMF